MSDMQDDEIEVMAVEMRKFGAKTSPWAQKRRIVAHGNTNRGFLDFASEYTMLSWLGRGEGVRAPKPSVATAKKARLEGWINVLLGQHEIQIDQDSAFRCVFEELRRDLGIPLVPILADAHFTHGKIKRRVHFSRT